MTPHGKRSATPAEGFLAELSAPARRALERAGLTTLPALARCTEGDILALHGVGPSTIPKLKRALSRAGLKLKR